LAVAWPTLGEKSAFRFLNETAAGYARSHVGRRSSLLGHVADFTKSDTLVAQFKSPGQAAVLSVMAPAHLTGDDRSAGFNGPSVRQEMSYSAGEALLVPNSLGVFVNL